MRAGGARRELTSRHQLCVAATFHEVNGELQQPHGTAAADERGSSGTPGDAGTSGVRLRRAHERVLRKRAVEPAEFIIGTVGIGG